MQNLEPTPDNEGDQNVRDTAGDQSSHRAQHGVGFWGTLDRTTVITIIGIIISAVIGIGTFYMALIQAHSNRAWVTVTLDYQNAALSWTGDGAVMGLTLIAKNIGDLPASDVVLSSNLIFNDIDFQDNNSLIQFCQSNLDEIGNEMERDESETKQTDAAASSIDISNGESQLADSFGTPVRNVHDVPTKLVICARYKIQYDQSWHYSISAYNVDQYDPTLPGGDYNFPQVGVNSDDGQHFLGIKKLAYFQN